MIIAEFNDYLVIFTFPNHNGLEPMLQPNYLENIEICYGLIWFWIAYLSKKFNKSAYTFSFPVSLKTS